jgi:hypothetical protein
MNVPIEWDGKTRIGPLVIGMTDSQMKAELPGQVIVDPSPLVNPDDGYTWESGEYGLAVAVVDGIVVSISSTLELLVDGDNIIGMPKSEALWRLGGEIGCETGEVEIVETAAGLVLHCINDHVVRANLDNFDLIGD